MLVDVLALRMVLLAIFLSYPWTCTSWSVGITYVKYVIRILFRFKKTGCAMKLWKLWNHRKYWSYKDCEIMEITSWFLIGVWTLIIFSRISCVSSTISLQQRGWWSPRRLPSREKLSPWYHLFLYCGFSILCL